MLYCLNDGASTGRSGNGAQHSITLILYGKWHYSYIQIEMYESTNLRIHAYDTVLHNFGTWIKNRKYTSESGGERA